MLLYGQKTAAILPFLAGAWYNKAAACGYFHTLLV